MTECLEFLDFVPKAIIDIEKISYLAKIAGQLVRVRPRFHSRHRPVKYLLLLIHASLRS